jgi:hypothetical protein
LVLGSGADDGDVFISKAIAITIVAERCGRDQYVFESRGENRGNESRGESRKQTRRDERVGTTEQRIEQK